MVSQNSMFYKYKELSIGLQTIISRNKLNKKQN